jgi:hypothetical protein
MNKMKTLKQLLELVQRNKKSAVSSKTTILSQDQFARLLFDQDKENGLYDMSATYETISDDERYEHTRAAECFLSHFDEVDWPAYVRERMEK